MASGPPRKDEPRPGRPSVDRGLDASASIPEATDDAGPVPEPGPGEPAPRVEASRGFVFGVSGAAYLGPAILAARSVARTNPGVPIDLFTDQPSDHPVFARIHQLDRAWFRPKFEALRRSRFERTIYLDVDVRVLASLADVFEALGRFDLAGAHDQYRNARRAVIHHGEPVPAAFPQINSGVLGLRASEATRRLMAEVEADVAASGARKDQPVLRAHLWRSELRILILPEEYNLMAYRTTLMWSGARAAPRVIHSPRLKDNPSVEIVPLTGGAIARHVRALLAGDRTLAQGPRRRMLAPSDRSPGGALRRLSEAASRRIARLRTRRG